MELQDKQGRKRKGWNVGSNLKGVRLDAEGGGASLDEEKLSVPLDTNENGGEGSTIAEKGVVASVSEVSTGPVTGKKVRLRKLFPNER